MVSVPILSVVSDDVADVVWSISIPSIFRLNYYIHRLIWRICKKICCDFDYFFYAFFNFGNLSNIPGNILRFNRSTTMINLLVAYSRLTQILTS